MSYWMNYDKVWLHRAQRAPRLRKRLSPISGCYVPEAKRSRADPIANS